MTEDEEREINPRILKERIDSLEWLVGVLIGTLTEHQKGYLEERLADRSRMTEENARRMDTDPARDEAVVAYDLERSILNMSEDSAGGFSIYLKK